MVRWKLLEWDHGGLTGTMQQGRTHFCLVPSSNGTRLLYSVWLCKVIWQHPRSSVFWIHNLSSSCWCNKCYNLCKNNTTNTREDFLHLLREEIFSILIHTMRCKFPPFAVLHNQIPKIHTQSCLCKQWYVYINFHNNKAESALLWYCLCKQSRNSEKKRKGVGIEGGGQRWVSPSRCRWLR